MSGTTQEAYVHRFFLAGFVARGVDLFARGAGFRRDDAGQFATEERKYLVISPLRGIAGGDVRLQMFDKILVKHVFAASAIAAPGGEIVISRGVFQAGPDRVEFDVGHAGGQGVYALKNHAFETAAPELSGAVAGLVVDAGELALAGRHKPADVDHFEGDFLTLRFIFETDDRGSRAEFEDFFHCFVVAVVAFDDDLERRQFVGAGSVDHEVKMVAHPGGGDDLDQKVIAEVSKQFEAVFFVGVGERVFAFDAADAVVQVVVAACAFDLHSRFHFVLLWVGLEIIYTLKVGLSNCQTV